MVHPRKALPLRRTIALQLIPAITIAETAVCYNVDLHQPPISPGALPQAPALPTRPPVPPRGPRPEHYQCIWLEGTETTADLRARGVPERMVCYMGRDSTLYRSQAIVLETVKSLRYLAISTSRTLPKNRPRSYGDSPGSSVLDRDLNVALSSLVASIEAGGPLWDVSSTEGSQGCALEEPPLQCLVFSRSAWLRMTNGTDGIQRHR